MADRPIEWGGVKLPCGMWRRESSRWMRRARKELMPKGTKCDACNDALATELHHIIPVKSKDCPLYDINNLMPLCVPCHRKIEATGGEFTKERAERLAKVNRERKQKSLDKLDMITRMRDIGISWENIGYVMGENKECVRQIHKLYSGKRQHTDVKWTIMIKNIRKARRLRAEGMLVRDIMDVLNAGKSTVEKWLNKWGDNKLTEVGVTI